MGIRFEVSLLAGVRRDEQAGVYVSYAPALDLYSQGATEADTLRAMESAVRLYIRTAYEEGILEKVLKRHRITPIATSAPLFPKEYIRILDERHFDRQHEVSATVELALA